jgi:hypothetical protein
VLAPVRFDVRFAASPPPVSQLVRFSPGHPRPAHTHSSSDCLWWWVDVLNSPHPCARNRPSKNWRRRPDLNRGWFADRAGTSILLIRPAFWSALPLVFPFVWALLFPNCSQVLGHDAPVRGS